MLFREVIGQQLIKQHIVKMVQENRLSHALLFAGPTGSGKLPMALALAQYLNCTNKQNDDSCGECASCKKSAKLIHSDQNFVFPVIKSKPSETPVSDTYIGKWREFVLKNPYFNLNQWFGFMDSEKGQGMIYSQESSEIIRKLNMKAFEGEYKVMVIWHPEKMHTTASNRLLKMIEEPPSKTIFILVSNNPGSIIGTILSRTQQIKFPRLSDEEVQKSLIEREKLDENTAKSIAKLASGDYVSAVELASESEELAFFFDQFVSLMRLAYGRKLMDLLGWVDGMLDQSKERQKNFLLYAIRMIRENYLMNFRQPSIVYLTPEEETFSSKFSPYINDGNVHQISEELSLAHSHLEQNGNARIIFTDFVLKLIILLKE